MLTQVKKKLNRTTSKEQIHSKIRNCSLNKRQEFPSGLKWLTRHSEIINESAKDAVWVRERHQETALGLHSATLIVHLILLFFVFVFP